jgi:hypothetical protein
MTRRQPYHAEGPALIEFFASSMTILYNFGRADIGEARVYRVSSLALLVLGCGFGVGLTRR